MGFTSLGFLLFFPVVLVVYFALPRKARTAWLLAASYFFAASFGWNVVLALLASTVVTYLAGIWIERTREDGK